MKVFHLCDRILLFFTFSTFTLHIHADKYVFIKDYYQSNELNDLLILGCDSNSIFVKMAKYYSTFSFLTNFYRMDNFLTVSIILLQNTCKILGIAIDMNCPNSIEFLQKLSATLEYPFNFKNKWLLFGDQMNGTTIVLSKLNINIDAEITLVKIFNESYILYEVYNTGKKHNGNLIIDYSGYWNDVEKLNLVQKPYKYSRRSNLTGVLLKCMIVIRNKGKQSLKDYLLSTENTHLDSMHRFNYALLLHLQDIYNFRYYMMKTLSWGYKHNNTFDGMVGELEKKHVDIGGSPIFFRLERAEVIDYTIQTWVARTCFIFRHPKRATSTFLIYLRPFNNKVWFCAVSIILLVFGLAIILSNIQKKINPSLEEISKSEIILLISAAISQQGSTNNFLMSSGRIITLSVFIFSLLFYQFYSGSIVSSLLMEPPKTIKTLKNLLDSNLKAGIEDILYTIDYFEKTNDNVALQLYEKKIFNHKYHNLFTPEKGLKMVQKGEFAFHVDTAIAYKIITENFSDNEICDLSEINLLPEQKMMSIVQKNSPFRKLVTYGLRKIAERGLMARQKLVWHARKPQCFNTPDTSKFNVTITEFIPVLMLLACSMLLSTIFLVIEVFDKGY